MSIFSIILGLLASGFAVHSAGNLKGTWNKSVESYQGNSFFSPGVKKGFDVADKAVKTTGYVSLAIDNFTGGNLQTAALQSVLDIAGGKLPKTGEKLKETVSNAGSIFASPEESEKVKDSGSMPTPVPITSDQPSVSNLDPQNLDKSADGDGQHVVVDENKDFQSEENVNNSSELNAGEDNRDDSISVSNEESGM